MQAVVIALFLRGIAQGLARKHGAPSRKIGALMHG